MISAQGLSVGYKLTGGGTRTVLDSVDLTIQNGLVTCLIGPNGSGKSTLIRSLAGLQPVLGGEVQIMEHSLNVLSRSEVAHFISVVLTAAPLVGNMTVREVVALGRYPHTNWLMKMNDADKSVLDSAVAMTRIEDLLETKVNQLSDGQLQKTLIARALAQDSEIILLDEPTAHLDLNNRVEIMRLMRVMAHEKNRCILMATHELDLALQMADRLILINTDGQMHEGIPEDLVLDGQIDRTFQLKGYDLKSGKAEFTPSRASRVFVQGQGHLLLWTRNALERTGYETVDDSKTADFSVSIDGDLPELTWRLQDSDTSFNTIEDLLAAVKSDFA